MLHFFRQFPLTVFVLVKQFFFNCNVTPIKAYFLFCQKIKNAMKLLNEIGWAPLEFQWGVREREIFESWAKHEVQHSKAKSDKAGRFIRILKASPEIMKSKMMKTFDAIAVNYMNCHHDNLIMVGIQSIWAPPFSAQQVVHRDHHCGPRLALTFGISLAEPLQTLFDTAIHYMERQPPHDALVKRMSRTLTHQVVFDPYIRHAGPATSEAVSDPHTRIFISYIKRCDENKMKYITKS